MGRVYDVNALSKLENTLQFQENEFQNIDKEDGVQKNKIIRYSVLLIGISITLIGLKIFLKNK